MKSIVLLLIGFSSLIAFITATSSKQSKSYAQIRRESKIIDSLANDNIIKFDSINAKIIRELNDSTRTN
jgi:hypothetical protein